MKTLIAVLFILPLGFAARAADPGRAFKTSYRTWVRDFATRAERLKVSEPNLEVGRLPVPTPLDPDLAIDYLYLPAKETPEQLVVINSGIHGVEAAAGVAVQSLLLDDCLLRAEAFQRARTAVLIIHVINPYGAKYGRRVNANNVDLNRNCFDANEAGRGGFPGAKLQNADYRDVRWLLEQPITQWDIFKAAITTGQDKIKSALKGQYHYPEGIYFGGQAVQPECTAVQSLLTRYVPASRNIVLLDMHTGLGAKGINHLMPNAILPPAKPEVYAAYRRELGLLHNMFPSEECDGLCVIDEPESMKSDRAPAAGVGFATVGDVTQWIYTRYPEKRLSGTVVSVTAEIGTYSARYMLEGLVNENYCRWHSDDCGARQTLAEIQNLRHLFNPGDPAWQDQVLRNGRQICHGLGRFSRMKRL